MALDLKFEVSFSADSSTIYIDDTTGVYTANNLGGWGTPNTDRADVALVTYIKYQPFTGVFVNLTDSANSPEVVVDFSSDTDKQFNINYYKDGWYNINLIAVPAYTDALAPANITANNIFYSTTSSRLKYYDGSSVIEITTDTQYETLLTSSYTQENLDAIYTRKLEIQYNCLLDAYTDLLETEKEYETTEDNLIKLKFLIQATVYRFYSDKKYEAQKMTENLTKQYKCCN
jgi:hypothetical protein